MRRAGSGITVPVMRPPKENEAHKRALAKLRQAFKAYQDWQGDGDAESFVDWVVQTTHKGRIKTWGDAHE